jgi:hypothetical protein
VHGGQSVVFHELAAALIVDSIMLADVDNFDNRLTEWLMDVENPRAAGHRRPVRHPASVHHRGRGEHGDIRDEGGRRLRAVPSRYSVVQMWMLSQEAPTDKKSPRTAGFFLHLYLNSE